MKKFVFFLLLWIVGIFFQSFFDIVITFWKINIIYCIAYPVLVLFRHPVYAVYSFFLGLTYDYLSVISPGIYGLTFFLAYYIFYFFSIKHGEFFKHFLFSVFLFTSIHLVVIALKFIFFNQNYLNLFFQRTIWIEIFPTIILLLGIYFLIKGIVKNFGIIDT